MYLLINDLVQTSDAPDSLKSPALADIWDDDNEVDIVLAASSYIDCIGFGYTDATEVTVTPDAGTPEVITVGASPNENGLYMLATPFTNDEVNVTHNGTYIGRVAMGFARPLGVAPTREAGFYSSHSNRVTESGQVIPGAGGYSGRRIAVDFRYKIDSDIFGDFQTAYDYISRGYPFFMAFTTKEQVRLPWSRLYAAPDKADLLLQSSVNRFLYSKSFDFLERF